MRVITEPTILAEVSDVESIKKEGVEALQALLNDAFEAGRQQAAVTVKKPSKVESLIDKGSVSIPDLTSWQEIKDEGPSNPIERFQLDQTPIDDSMVEMFESQLMEALKFAVKKYS